MKGISWSRIILYCLIGCAGIYLGDYLSVRMRMPSAVQKVEVQHFLAVPLKNGKYEFDFDGNEMVPCVKSLLPHLGYQPCWYLQRHRNQAEKL